MKFSEVLSLNGKKCACERIHSAAYATVPRHAARIDNIVNNYDKIIAMITEGLPDAYEIESILKKMGAPTTLSDLGLGEKYRSTIFKATKDIRVKYVLSHLAWDLGVEDELYR